MRSLTSMSLRMRTVAVIAGLVLSCWPGSPAAPGARADTGVAGKTVVLDPGHAGGNDGNLSRQVPNGRGGTKDCQASGTSTEDGLAEHTFAWDGRPGQTFEFQLARDAAFTQLVFERQLTEPKLDVPLPGTGRFFVRLRARDPDGFMGPYTTPQSFEVPNCWRDSAGACVSGGDGQPLQLGHQP